jgi:hypothetical protein
MLELSPGKKTNVSAYIIPVGLDPVFTGNRSKFLNVFEASSYQTGVIENSGSGYFD